MLKKSLDSYHASACHNVMVKETVVKPKLSDWFQHCTKQHATLCIKSTVRMVTRLNIAILSLQDKERAVPSGNRGCAGMTRRSL
jgi:hypothetical protein